MLKDKNVYESVKSPTLWKPSPGAVIEAIMVSVTTVQIDEKPVQQGLFVVLDDASENRCRRGAAIKMLLNYSLLDAGLLGFSGQVVYLEYIGYSKLKGGRKMWDMVIQRRQPDVDEIALLPKGNRPSLDPDDMPDY